METIFSKDNSSGKKYIAFFDLDRTIISANSGKVLIQTAYKKGLISRMDLLRGIYISLLYRFSLKDTLKLINSMVGWLKGVSESALTDLSEEIFNTQLLKSIRPVIREKINFHKIQGGKVVILSSAILPVCKPVARNLGMDDIICSNLEISNHIFTGYPTGLLCFGNEKVTRLIEYCKEYNTDPFNSWYYGDSIADLPVLMSVGNPVCVNPDRKLFREAKKRGWPILDSD